jgi:ankyrin repeat protein
MHPIEFFINKIIEIISHEQQNCQDKRYKTICNDIRKTDNYNQIFVFCCRYGSLEAVTDLLSNDKYKIIPDFDNNIAISKAISYGNYDIVKLLLLYNVNPSIRNNDALKWASMRGCVDCIILALQDSRINIFSENHEHNDMMYQCYGIVDKVGSILENAKSIIQNLYEFCSDDNMYNKVYHQKIYNIIKLIFDNNKFKCMHNNNEKNHMIFWGCNLGYYEVVKYFAKYMKNNVLNECIIIATDNNYCKIKQLLQNNK